MIDADLAARRWATSGCQALSDPGMHVPVRLVAGVSELIRHLDGCGAGLAEAFGSDGLGILAERADALMLARSGRSSCGGATRLVRTADEWMAVTLARQDDRRLLPAWLGTDPKASSVTAGSNPWPEVERRVAGRGAAELVELAALLGLACARIGETTDRFPHELEGLRPAAARPMSGARVLNLASLWAGPLCADVLRRVGADVVTLESVSRPDGARATPHWFDAIHAGQRSVAVDLRTREGIERTTRLIEAADVVIEGSRPRALLQLGIDARALVASPRPQVWVSITGYGRTRNAGMRVALGDDAAVAGGVVGWVDEEPVFVGDAVADPLAGLFAARAAIEMLARGHRGVVDVAMARAAATLATRPKDPLCPPLAEFAPARPSRASARALSLGADTEAVVHDWGVDRR